VSAYLKARTHLARAGVLGDVGVVAVRETVHEALTPLDPMDFGMSFKAWSAKVEFYADRQATNVSSGPRHT
jgi:hypothetical protein